MAFGLNVSKASGVLVYSSADVTWNQVDSFLVGGGQTVTKTYSVLVGREFLAAQMLVDPPPLNRKAIAHTITRSNGQVTVSGGSERAYILVLMR